MLTETPPSAAQVSDDFLTGGGEMAKVIAAKDWGETPLGPIDNWPQSLRTTVSLCLASNFPISIAWGPGRTQIYNDGYWPICGAKHPSSMGQDFRECWASAWPVIGDAFESAEKGEPRYLENQRLFLDRNGYIEETFFTFSFSPIRDKGGVQGLFHPVTETTARMLSERRTRAIRDLASCSQASTSVAAACAAVINALAAYRLDVPFALVYLLDEGREELQLAGDIGIEVDRAASAIRLRLDSGGPVAGAILSNEFRVVELPAADLAVRASGPYPEPPSKAVVLPISWSSAERQAGVLVAGISPRLALDDDYRSFYHLVASQIAAAVATGRAYEAERQRAEALAELDKAKTAFFSNVSHEFRTPLTLMLGPLEEMLAHEDVSVRRKELDLVYRNALRLLRLVNALLDFSRIEAGRSDAVFEPVDLSAFTADIASTFRSAVEMAGLRLVVDCAALSEPVYADRSMWEIIVLNLLSNALKFTFEGEIRVVLRERNREVTLRVEDTGTGVPASELPRLFERFYRAEGARGRTFEGTGIGLALVRELANQHGGKAEAESEAGVGSTFRVSLPLGFAHLPPERVGPINGKTPRTPQADKRKGFLVEALGWLSASPGIGSSPGETEKSELTPRRARILVADDNADMREYIERLLTADYDVLAVSNGAQALRAALQDPPDLVISDVMMPELDGFGLLDALRRSDSTRLIPVVLLSARAGEESRSKGIGAGPDDYLVKPFVARELLARVRARIELTQLRSQLHEQEAINRHAAAIEEQWRLFDTALSNIPDHIYIYDPSLRFVYANRAALSYLRKPIEEWVGRNLSELGFPAHVVSMLEGHLSRVLASGQALQSEMMLIDPDGIERHYEYIFTPVFNDSGVVQAVTGTSREITERRKAEERFLLLSAVIEGARDFGIFMLDPDGHILTWNEGAQRIKGYSEAEIVGRHFSCFYLPEAVDSGLPDEELRIARSTGRFEDEGWRVRKDGSRFWATILITAVRDKDGKLRGFSKLTRDTTERRRTEERFQRVVEASPSAMIIIGVDGLITLVNTQTERLFGYDRRELLGRRVEMLVPERFRAHHPGHRALFFAAPTARPMGAGRDLFGVRKDGREVPIEIGLSPISTNDGQFVLASVIDITERKLFEAELQEKSAEMERFTYTVSHDLKSPLITIKSYISMIDQDLATGNFERTRPDLQRIARAADRMQVLLGEVGD